MEMGALIYDVQIALEFTNAPLRACYATCTSFLGFWGSVLVWPYDPDPCGAHGQYFGTHKVNSLLLCALKI